MPFFIGETLRSFLSADYTDLVPLRGKDLKPKAETIKPFSDRRPPLKIISIVQSSAVGLYRIDWILKPVNASRMAAFTGSIAFGKKFAKVAFFYSDVKMGKKGLAQFIN
jgi:hypothetical protein